MKVRILARTSDGESGVDLDVNLPDALEEDVLDALAPAGDAILRILKAHLQGGREHAADRRGGGGA